MKIVKCINERLTHPGQIMIGNQYWMDENSIWKDSDGNEYAAFYSSHIPIEMYKIGYLKTSHFEILHDCTQCIYNTYHGECKGLCMILKGEHC